MQFVICNRFENFNLNVGNGDRIFMFILFCLNLGDKSLKTKIECHIEMKLSNDYIVLPNVKIKT